ncbi:LysR family transcriptional regulator [Kocuria aegyptia]|uniref:LysR substrate-binding domain-containing protein n=1 Tax=Kocuria aegyptia TaxID=330943 RepID=A0ABN2KHN9_9MICC
MDIRQLTYFLAVVDHGGFTRAAEQLIIAQPSLSQAIKGLERELGVPLFHRIGRRVVLSEAGRELVGPARVVVRDLEAARAAVDDLRGVRTGRLEVITMPSPGVEPLTGMIAAYTGAHPAVTVGVDAAFTPEEVAHAVRTGRAEIGILGSDRPFRSAEVDVLHLEQQPLELIVNPRADTFGDGEAIGREDLAGHRVVVSPRGSLMRWLVDDALAGGVQVQITAEVAHRTSVLPLVLAGVGHAVLPSSWTPLARAAGLRVLRLEPVTVLHVAVLSRPGHLTPAARAFLEVAARHIEDRPRATQEVP